MRERTPTLAEVLGVLTAALERDVSPHETLTQVVMAARDAVQADVAVLRVRDADRVVARSSAGLDPEVTSGFSVPLEQAGTTSDAPAAVGSDAPAFSPPMRAAGVRALLALPVYEVDHDRKRVLRAVLYVGHVNPPDGGATAALATWHPVLAGLLTLLLRAQRSEDAVHARDTVLAVVAHDLRNPINVISLAASSLEQRITDAALKRPVERILRGAQRADRLIRNLLDVNAIEAGRFSIEARPVEPAGVILAAIESQQTVAASANVIIATDVAPALPSIDGDEERLLELLENLVGSAIKFTDAGSTITVGATPRKDDLLVWVKDPGESISPDDLPHLFDRFWQGKKTYRRGSGLGLTICRAIVEAHGGHIWAESGGGAGTTVSLTLPFSQRAARPTHPQPAGILMVDDREEDRSRSR